MKIHKNPLQNRITWCFMNLEKANSQSTYWCFVINGSSWLSSSVLQQHLLIDMLCWWLSLQDIVVGSKFFSHGLPAVGLCCRWGARRERRYGGGSSQDRVGQRAEEGRHLGRPIILHCECATPPRFNEIPGPCVGVHSSSNISNAIKTNLAAALPPVN